MSIGSKISEYFATSKVELQKVVWPTKRDTFRYSVAVIGVSLSIALFFGVLDFVFNLGLEKFILTR